MKNKNHRVLATGEALFLEGETGHEAFAIESGAVDIYIERPEGRSVLARLSKDDIFGEMALAGDHTRTASAMAIVPTVLTVITHEYLAERLDRADPMLRHLLRVTMARCRDSLRTTGSGKTAAAAQKRGDGQDSLVDRDIALRRLHLEQDLERALENGEFQLHFQPIVRLADGSTAGFEALIRWLKPGVGKVPPDEFIWVAEESGLISAIGRWVIRSACESINRLETAHHLSQPDAEPLFITVNLSIRQFSDPDLFADLKKSLEAEGLAPKRVKLEITESLVMNNLDASLALLNRCKSLGCQLVVDDFGTGYSSLSYLHKFPMDALKLDRSFIRDAVGNPPALKIVRAISNMAIDLGMETVAEGIETAHQAEASREADIRYGQGFLWSRALPLEEAAAYCRSSSASRVA